MAQGARGNDLASGLETQQCDGQALTPVDLIVQKVKPAFDDRRLDEPRRKQYESSLYNKTPYKCSATTLAECACCKSEDEAAQCKAENGYQALRPSVGTFCLVMC